MKTVKSKYKILGGFTLVIVLNLLCLPLSSLILVSTIEAIFTLNNHWQGAEIGIACFIIFLQLFLLKGFVRDCKYIKIDEDKITFINPILPFLRKIKHLSEYEYKQTVEEVSGSDTREALWLIKNGKVTDRFSSFYYSNYDELKNNIAIENKGELRINPFKQIGHLLFGMKISNN